MANSSSSSSSSGVGFTSLLTVAFIVLKLTGTINWSWWWVLLPVWISAIISLVVIAVSIWLYIKKDRF